METYIFLFSCSDFYTILLIAYCNYSIDTFLIGTLMSKHSGNKGLYNSLFLLLLPAFLCVFSHYFVELLLLPPRTHFSGTVKLEQLLLSPEDHCAASLECLVLDTAVAQGGEMIHSFFLLTILQVILENKPMNKIQ